MDIGDMSLESQQNYDRLMKYLMNYAFDNHIGVEFTHKLSPFDPPISYNDPGKLIIMNGNWYRPIEIPFQLAHEICHVLYENGNYYHINEITKSKGESIANVFAIKLLMQYCVDNDIVFRSCYRFAECFGIPKEYYYLFENIA